ncbi:hypothetical protein IFT73_13570 [Aeromicrobium sp. CFBP 8757]|uniref:hypothetical protein n=1 Tax=Aeromicrobium sp. CFBP 8757 TaxID=2775288 RepID=UPI001787140D|nr:hypothetical protein [Aeromicrobium sp. CFBP 8757]MBD8607885.1 hypothetical protein [Aeromicrobium sp. CFBP 8757]
MSRPRRTSSRGHVPPLRFAISERGDIAYPLLTPYPVDGSIEDWPTLTLPRTQVDGADDASVAEAAESGDLTDLRLGDGGVPYTRHALVESFDYSLVPLPTLTLDIEPVPPSSRPTRLRFVDAVISDWTTDQDHEPGQPHNELCELTWDGAQTFLLEFFSFKILLRAARLEVGHAITS